MLLTTEQNLQKFKLRVDAAKLAGKDKIGVAVGKCVNQYKVAKHFQLGITDISPIDFTDEALVFPLSRGDIADELLQKGYPLLLLIVAILIAILIWGIHCGDQNPWGQVIQ